MNKFYEFGIDLGTTNSCISSYIDGKLTTYLNNDGKDTTPSAVYIDAKGNKRIGVRALSQLAILPNDLENDVKTEFKRQMGTNQMPKFKQANIEMSPIELSAEVLISIKLDALRLHRVQNKQIDNVVITVPAAFDNVQCENTIKAGKLAGFKNVELLQEPIAAAIAYGIQPNSKDKYWMVFDFGGGTTDVAIISTFNNRLQVLGHAGDNFLGGKDIDKQICEVFFKPMFRKNGLNIDLNTKKIRLMAEKVKIALTDLDEVFIDVDSLIDNNIDDFINTYETENSYKITKLEFEKSIQEIIDKAIELCDNALEQSKLDSSNIDEILLVGGTTLIPSVYSSLKSKFNLPMRNDNPLTVVSRGAAIYGASVKVEDTDEDVKNHGEFDIKLEYEPVTSKTKYSILGKVTSNTSKKPISIRFERNDWSSEWVNISKNGIFEVDLLLYENATSTFEIFVLDDSKYEHKLEQSVKMRQDNNNLIISAPPLPHSVCIEIIVNDEYKTVLDPILKRGTSLPSKASRTYKATNSVTPGTGEELNIFLWEGDNLDVPKANKRIKIIQIKGQDITNKIYKGEDIEITLEMDKSRSSVLEAYIPSSDQTIRHEFIYKANYEDIYSTLTKINEELSNYEDVFDDYEDSNLSERISDAYQECDELIERFDEDEVTDNLIDDAQNFINQYLKLSIEIENNLNEKNQNDKLDAFESKVESIRNIVEEDGDRNDLLKFEELEESYEAVKETQNIKLMEKVLSDMTDLMYTILLKDLNFLIYQFDQLIQKDTDYKDKAKFLELKYQGINQANNSDAEGLRRTIFDLLGIMEQKALKEVTENIQRVGLRK